MISALNHELRNHAIKYGAIVKRYTMHRPSTGWIRPVLRSFRKPDEVRDPDRGLVRKKRAWHFASGSVTERGWMRCSTCRRPFNRRLYRWRCLNATLYG